MRLPVMAVENQSTPCVIPMPKAKPTQVIVHRIELQEKERDALDALVAGQTVKNVVVPVAIVGGVGAAGYLGYKTLKEMYGWTEDLVEEWVDGYKAHVGTADVILETQPGPLGNFYRVAKWFVS